MKPAKRFRVPKRVRDQASYGLTEVESLTGASPEAFQVARFLTSGEPIGPAVLNSMNRYFFDHQRQPLDFPEAKMYGGRAGREWASRCLAATKPVTASAEPMERPPWDLSDDEVDMLIQFSRELSERVGMEPPDGLIEPGSMQELAAEEAHFLSVDEGDMLVESSAEPEEGPSGSREELEEHIETALGLATQLDETVEKLADALEDAIAEEMDEDDDADDEFEASMVRDALAEVVYDGASLNELTATDFSAEAAEARERMAKASLVRERSLAMAKMASARMTLAAAGDPAAADPGAGEGAEAPADADPKARNSDHHSTSQPRDWHGRFAKVGARVRGKDGTLGFVTGIEDGQLVVEDDDGNSSTVDPKSVEVVTKKSRARLPEPMKPLEDPKARLEAYLEWAREQMGVGA